ncbi:hydrolase [Anaerotalea alkaliphila]|uniref:Hydrolase n=1 Tax=Anaerotalea alkaliphila TaxID=2662126 RepID=A0A7X5KMD8_9FIRM|nr:hydrolase [Anaerotalea alkaliphila]NDL66603.1 hydrolase [Anaerotalea alkaliphila]
MEGIPSREEALALLLRYNKTDSLVRHALTVEGVMAHFAGLYPGEDPRVWGVMGLVHDLDYEMYPQEHCNKAEEILRAEGWPQEAVRAVLSHGYGICTQVRPESDLEKVLYAVDELTGLITATALMRPDRSVMDLEVKSVMKKWKQKNFAAGVDRSLIGEGVRNLGMTVEAVVEECIRGMRKIAPDIGLAGME